MILVLTNIFLIKLFLKKFFFFYLLIIYKMSYNERLSSYNQGLAQQNQNIANMKNSFIDNAERIRSAKEAAEKGQENLPQQIGTIANEVGGFSNAWVNGYESFNHVRHGIIQTNKIQELGDSLKGKLNQTNTDIEGLESGVPNVEGDLLGDKVPFSQNVNIPNDILGDPKLQGLGEEAEQRLPAFGTGGDPSGEPVDLDNPFDSSWNDIVDVGKELFEQTEGQAPLGVSGVVSDVSQGLDNEGNKLTGISEDTGDLSSLFNTLGQEPNIKVNNDEMNAGTKLNNLVDDSNEALDAGKGASSAVQKSVGVLGDLGEGAETLDAAAVATSEIPIIGEGVGLVAGLTSLGSELYGLFNKPKSPPPPPPPPKPPTIKAGSVGVSFTPQASGSSMLA